MQAKPGSAGKSRHEWIGDFSHATRRPKNWREKLRAALVDLKMPRERDAVQEYLDNPDSEE
jgi:hypothetical protein